MNNIKNSKKKIKVTTAISLLVGLMIMPTIADASTYKTTSKLNLRTGPSTDKESIVMIPKNANVEYLGESGSWYNVKYGNSQGYISNQYVIKTENMENAIIDGEKYSTASNLNLRAKASIHSEKLTTIPKGKSVSLINKNGEWYKIQYGNSQGYVNSKYLSGTTSNVSTSLETQTSSVSNEKQQYMTTSNLNLRVGESTGSKKLTTIQKGKSVSLISKNGEWYKVKYDDLEGYVNNQYLKRENDETGNTNVKDTKPHTKSINRPTASVARNKVVDQALSLNGKVTYFWGGKTNKTSWDSNWGQPKRVIALGNSNSGKVIPFGIDCSGFVDWSFRSAGLGKSFSKGGTAMQWDATHSIKESELKIGDLAFKQTPWSKGANHIGIYVGNNNNGEKLFIHSSFTQNGVAVTTAKVGQLSIYRRPNVFN